VNNLLGVFDDDESEPVVVRPLPMSADQRSEIRDLFARLGISSARRQFEVTAELTGVRIASVAELGASDAHRLIIGLKRRLEALGRVTTGSSWDNREEDTWIDRL